MGVRRERETVKAQPVLSLQCSGKLNGDLEGTVSEICFLVGEVTASGAQALLPTQCSGISPLPTQCSGISPASALQIVWHQRSNPGILHVNQVFQPVELSLAPP